MVNIVNIVTSTKARVARCDQKTWIQPILTALSPPPSTSQSPSACGQTPEPPCLPCERPTSSWSAFLREKEQTYLLYSQNCLRRQTDWNILNYNICTTGFAAGQVQNDGLDILSCSRGVGSPRPAEVAEWSDSFSSKVVGRQPVIVHHSEGQTGVPVPVLFRTDMTGRQ